MKLGLYWKELLALREAGNTKEYDAFADELLRTLFNDFMKPGEHLQQWHSRITTGITYV